MQEPGSPLVPLDPSRFREMVEKQHVATQQQLLSQQNSGSASSTPISQTQQHPLANQYYRENLTRTQSTSSVGSSESAASAPPPPQMADVAGHFQQQMSPQYSPHVGGQPPQQRFWYPHAHPSPRSTYPGPPSVAQSSAQQPMTPQPVRTPQSVGSVNSPRMANPPSHTPGSQVMSPDMAQSSPGSARSPMGSPIQPQVPQQSIQGQQTRLRATLPHPQGQPMVYQQQPGYPPNYQIPQQQQAQPQAFSPNYSMAHGQPQAYPRPYGAPPRPGMIVVQQQQMVGGRPVMIRQPHYVQRQPGMPVPHLAPGQQLPPGAYQDQAAGRPQQFVQYGQQQHPMVLQHPGPYGKPAAFSPGGQVAYVSAEGSSTSGGVQHFVSVAPGQVLATPVQQRYATPMQQIAQQQVGVISPPMMQRVPGSTAVTQTYGSPTTMQQFQRAMAPQHYASGVALNPHQAPASASTLSPVASGAQLQSPAMIQQQAQPPQGAARFQQVLPQQAVAVYSNQVVLHQQQVRGVAPGAPVHLEHLAPQQHPIDASQQIRQQGGYDMSSPQQQQIHQQLQPRMLHHGAIQGQLVSQQQQQEMKVQFFGHEPHVNVPPEMCLIGGVFLIVDYDRILDQKEVGDWRLVIALHGGEVETSYSAKCTHVICESLRHPVVQQALKEGKRCVTAQWLNDCLLQKRLQPPWKAVHFPSQYGDNKPCKNKIFSVCGFDANERSCLKQMIMAVGGRFTSYLTKQNAFLVSKWYNLDDIKVSKAMEWKIPIVNVQFLTELFLGQGAALQNTNNPKYHQFLPRELMQQQHPNAIDPFRIDPAIMPALMASWRIPITFTSECWKNALERKQKIESDDGKIFPHKKLKLSPAPDDNEIENHRRSLSLGASFPKICFTGLYPAEADNLTRKALWLGSEIVDVKNCTHLVACDLKRTQKLLHGIILGKLIVTPLWIRQSYKQQQFVDALEYLVKDEGNEKFFGFNLKLSIYRARQAKLFQNMVFYVTPSVQPHLSILRELIQTAGGSVLQQRPPSKRILELQQEGVQLTVITCDNDLHLCQSLLDSGIAVHSAELVLTGILRQEVDFASYKLEPRQNDASTKAGRDA